jgi:hypothetical protein
VPNAVRLAEMWQAMFRGVRRQAVILSPWLGSRRWSMRALCGIPGTCFALSCPPIG